MLASELIKQLTTMIKENGDAQVVCKIENEYKCEELSVIDYAIFVQIENEKYYLIE